MRWVLLLRNIQYVQRALLQQVQFSGIVCDFLVERFGDFNMMNLILPNLLLPTTYSTFRDTYSDLSFCLDVNHLKSYVPWDPLHFFFFHSISI
ncbi:MAG: hypothetical protein LBR92_00440 [Puniceicoccales bacterium]|nr:hypothetical protein [Puniceicoccales bacterium]